MKKLSLIPKRDTITICLPPDWVGKKITCFLSSAAETDVKETRILMAAERTAKYNAKQKNKQDNEPIKKKSVKGSAKKDVKKTAKRSVKGSRKQATNEGQPQSNA